MATLTEVSFYTRRFIKYGSVVLVVLMLLPLVWRGLVAVYLKINPPPPAAPTVAYGKIAKPALPSGDTAYKPSYRLETVDGKLPVLPNVARVYLVDVNKSRLLQLDHVKSQARTLGFTGEPEKIDEQTYKFTHPTLPATLTVNIIYNQYTYKYDWTADQTLFSAAQVPNNDQAFLAAKNFWQTLDLLGADLADGSAKYSYFAAQPPAMIATVSLSEANFIRVDMFRSAKDKMPFVTPSGQNSPVYVIFSGSTDRSRSVVEASYLYSNLIADDFATYPLRTVAAAWDELSKGGGYVAHAGGANVVVRKAYLAYFESDTPQEFVQPVYVFEGDGGYMGYVTALDASYLQ